MELTRANLDRLREDWKVTTFEAFDAAPKPFWDRLAQYETSKNAINVYEQLVALPKMRRFRDQIVLQNLQSFQHRIANDEWESSVQVRQADVERDDIGRYTNMFKMLGMAARRAPDVTLAQVMTSGFSTLDYTGANFFAADKPHIPGVVDAGTFTNLMTEKPSVGSWEKARQLSANILDINGDPLSLGASMTVVCSTKWEPTWKRILNAELIMQVAGSNTAGAAVTNIYKGSADLVVFPYLNTSARENNWFVLDTTFPIRAFIYQEEVKTRFYAQDNPNTHEDAFKKHVFNYQAYARGEVGFGAPQLAIGSTGADAAL